MSPIDNILKKPTETFDYLINRGIYWRETIPLFASNGIIYVYYYMRSYGNILFDSNQTFLASILTMLTLGIIYGIVSNLILGFLISQTGKLFNANNNLKNIYNVMSWAYFPLALSIIILIPNLFMAKNVIQIKDPSFQILFAIIVLVLTLGFSALGIWSFILSIKGLKKAQGLNTTNTLLNFLIAGLIFGIFNYFLLNYDLT